MNLTPILAAAIAVTSALTFAVPANAASETPAVNTSGSTNPNAPVAGANSYTEGQAQSQIEAKGFTQVTELRKDDNGVWRGKAMKNGANMNVAVDFQGNVTTN
jgi:hypothetical protein